MSRSPNTSSQKYGFSDLTTVTAQQTAMNLSLEIFPPFSIALLYGAVIVVY